MLADNLGPVSLSLQRRSWILPDSALCKSFLVTISAAHRCPISALFPWHEAAFNVLCGSKQHKPPNQEAKADRPSATPAQS